MMNTTELTWSSNHTDHLASKTQRDRRRGIYSASELHVPSTVRTLCLGGYVIEGMEEVEISECMVNRAEWARL